MDKAIDQGMDSNGGVRLDLSQSQAFVTVDFDTAIYHSTLLI